MSKDRSGSSRKIPAPNSLFADEDHTRAMFDSALDCIVTFDHKGRICAINRAAEREFGVEREGIVGQELVELIAPPVSQEKHRRAIAELLSQNESSILGERVETRAVRADGTEFPVEFTITRSNTVDPPLFTAYLRDLTKQEEANEALLQSQRSLSALLSNLPGMAYRSREAGYRTMEFASEGCVELTGYEPSELIDNPDLSYYDLIDPDDLENVLDHLQAAVREQRAYQLTYRIRTASGGKRWVTERGHGIYSVFSSEGELLALEGFISDVTDQKRAETLLQNYNKTLEGEVAERIKELNAKNEVLQQTLSKLEATQDKLIMQEKMASLGALTAGIAHEIKNPLNFVNNFAALSIERAEELREEVAAQKDRIDEEAFQNLSELIDDVGQNAEKIREHGKRADSIMRSMLEHSRAKPGERRRIDLNELLEEDATLAYHGRRAHDPTFDVAFEKDFDEDLGEVDVIPQELGRVFLNLIDNGCHAVLEKRKAISEGFAPTVKISTRGFDDEVQIRIRDNGVGMSQEVLNNIFVPFFTTKPSGAGTGLGLSISYDIIVQKHQGTIEVDSKEGEYTEFVITLPRRT